MLAVSSLLYAGCHDTRMKMNDAIGISWCRFKTMRAWSPGHSWIWSPRELNKNYGTCVQIFRALPTEVATRNKAFIFCAMRVYIRWRLEIKNPNYWNQKTSDRLPIQTTRPSTAVKIRLSILAKQLPGPTRQSALAQQARIQTPHAMSICFVHALHWRQKLTNLCETGTRNVDCTAN